MDYSKLSDFGINKRVLAIKSGLKPLGYAHNADERSTGVVDVNGIYNWFDFCNNPADAWPIIHKQGISIAFDEDEDEWVAFSSFRFDKAGWVIPVTPKDQQTDKNPLRAAMVVFLKMKEGTHES